MRYLYVPAIALFGLLAACDADKVKDVVADNYCSLDSPAAGTTIRTNAPIELVGWAYNVATGTVPQGVSVQIVNAKNEVVLTAPATRIARPDVAKAFAKPALEMSGFVGKVDMAALESGVYTFKVVQQDGNTRYVCAAPKLNVQANKG